MNGKHWLLTIVITLGMLLTVSVGCIAPDSPGSRSDNGTSVIVNALDPKINNCSFWNAGPNGVIDILPFVDDRNLTNRQADVNTLGVGNITYFMINVSLDIATGGVFDLESVNVTAWFDNGTETDYSWRYVDLAVPRNYPNRNITLNYSFNLGQMFKIYPPTNEVSIAGLAPSFGYVSANTTEIALPFRWGPNIRWGPGDGAWNAAPGWNDLDSWNFKCRVKLDAGGNFDGWARTWHSAEFGTYKYTSFSVTGSPSTTQAPGSGWREFLASPDQEVTYTSNAPFNITANITQLKRTGSLNYLGSENLAIDGERLFPYKPFWDAPGGNIGDGYNFIAGANGTGYSSYAYINTGNFNLTNSGPTEIEWYAKVPVGTLEGTYTAKITWRLRTSTDASP